MSSKQTLVFLTTFEKKRDAQKFAHLVVSRGLAACVQIVPQIESVYMWKNRVNKAREILCIGKTTRAQVKKLKQKLISVHPYEVPELVFLPIIDGHLPYLNWIKTTCQSD